MIFGKEGLQVSQIMELSRENFKSREFYRLGGTRIDDLTTDHITRIPDVLKVNPEDKVKTLFQGMPEAAGWEMPRNEVLVIRGGRRMGKGSSRENSADAIANAGVKVVDAESFGPIFRTNLINNGVLPITRHELIWKSLAGETVAEEEWLAELSQVEKEIWRKGGLVNYISAIAEGELERPQYGIQERPIRPHTAIEKFLIQKFSNQGVDEIIPGDSLVVGPVDKIFGYDVFVMQAMDRVARAGKPVTYPLEQFYTSNCHFKGSTNPDAVFAVQWLQQFWADHSEMFQGREEVYIFSGLKRIKPGEFVVGMDSHTPHLALIPGVLAKAKGYTDIAASLISGGLVAETVPESIQVNFVGKLPAGCDMKDALWWATENYFKDGRGNNRLCEIRGEAYAQMSAVEASQVINIVTEWGCPAALTTEYNQHIVDYLRKQGNDLGGMTDEDIRHLLIALQADESAHYSEKVTIDLSQVVPHIALPGDHKYTIPLNTENPLPKIDRVIIASCGGSSIKELAYLAEILGDEEPQLPVDIHLASKSTIEEAKKMGIWEQLSSKRNIRISEEISCGPCMGHGAKVEENETVLSTNNRNYIGRMGAFSGKVVLGSGSIAAITAAQGKIPTLEDFHKYTSLIQSAQQKVRHILASSS